MKPFPAISIMAFLALLMAFLASAYVLGTYCAFGFGAGCIGPFTGWFDTIVLVTAALLLATVVQAVIVLCFATRWLVSMLRT